MRVFDCFLFFNELDLLEIRLHTLDPVVDKFIISEASHTFAGHPKPLHFRDNQSRFAAFKHKIVHQVVDDTLTAFDREHPEAEFFTPKRRSFVHKSGGTPLMKLNPTFRREVYQRDALIRPILSEVRDADMVMLSDLDEIPRPQAVREVAQKCREGDIFHFRQQWFMYFLNVLTRKEWFGTRACTLRTLKTLGSVDLLRFPMEDRSMQRGEIVEDGGWHFSFLGGTRKVKEKLRAYDYQGRRSRWLLKVIELFMKDRLERQIAQNRDIFLDGRSFETVPIDESFPRFIIENRHALQALIK